MCKTLCFLLLLILVSSTAAQDTLGNFSIITSDNAQNLREIHSWENMIRAAAFSPDGTSLAIFRQSGELEFVSIETLETLRVIEGDFRGRYWLNYSPDGSTILLSNPDQYTLIDVLTGEIIARHEGEEFYLGGFSADFQRYLQRERYGSGLSVHDMMTDEILFQGGGFLDYELSIDGQYLVTINSEAIVQVWNVNTQEVVFEIPPSVENFEWNYWSGTGFTPDGKVWVNRTQIVQTENRESQSSIIQFWDMKSQSLVQELVGDGYLAYYSLIFEPSNQYIMAWGMSPAYYNQCSLWNLSQNLLLPCPAGGNMWATFSPNGELLVVNSGTSYDVYLYELAKMEEWPLILDTEPTIFVGFSPDSRFLITLDLKLHLWAVPAN
jgi:WD40 repeat protein